MVSNECFKILKIKYFLTFVKGFCSLVRPQVNFNPEYDDLPFNVKMFGPKGDENTKTYTWKIKPGAKVNCGKFHI